MVKAASPEIPTIAAARAKRLEKTKEAARNQEKADIARRVDNAYKKRTILRKKAMKIETPAKKKPRLEVVEGSKPVGETIETPRKSAAKKPSLSLVRQAHEVLPDPKRIADEEQALRELRAIFEDLSLDTSDVIREWHHLRALPKIEGRVNGFLAILKSKPFTDRHVGELEEWLSLAAVAEAQCKNAKHAADVLVAEKMDAGWFTRVFRAKKLKKEMDVEHAFAQSCEIVQEEMSRIGAGLKEKLGRSESNVA